MKIGVQHSRVESRKYIFNEADIKALVIEAARKSPLYPARVPPGEREAWTIDFETTNAADDYCPTVTLVQTLTHEEPETVNAVDPIAADPGKLTPRV